VIHSVGPAGAEFAQIAEYALIHRMPSGADAPR